MSNRQADIEAAEARLMAAAKELGTIKWNEGYAAGFKVGEDEARKRLLKNLDETQN